MEFIDIAMWGAGAVIVVGLLEFCKGAFPKAPSWVWTLAVLLASGLTALAGNSQKPVWDGLGILALSQMCYQLIVQSIKKKFAPKEE
jgi:hypothetical protein